MTVTRTAAARFVSRSALVLGVAISTAEAGGIWPESNDVNDVDGPFVENLDIFYDDDTWQLYNEDGTIRVTSTAEQCAAAARPDLDEAYHPG